MVMVVGRTRASCQLLVVHLQSSVFSRRPGPDEVTSPTQLQHSSNTALTLSPDLVLRWGQHSESVGHTVELQLQEVIQAFLIS